MLTVLFLTATLIRTDDPKPADVKNATEALQGEWKAKSIVKDGFPESDVKSAFLKVEGNKLTIGMQKRESTSTFTIDPSKSPKEINVTVDDKKKVISQGIWKIEGDNLTICLCLTPDPSQRPKEFRSEKDSRYILFVFEKVRK